MGGEEYAVLGSRDASHRFDASSQRGAARSFPAQQGAKVFPGPGIAAPFALNLTSTDDFCSLVMALLLFAAVLRYSWALILGSAGGAVGSGRPSDTGLSWALCGFGLTSWD